MKVLKIGDTVIFKSGSGKRALEYEVVCNSAKGVYLNCRSGYWNGQIFEELGMPACDPSRESFCEKILGYRPGVGNWPESKPNDFEGVTKIVVQLATLCWERGGAVSINGTLWEPTKSELTNKTSDDTEDVSYRKLRVGDIVRVLPRQGTMSDYPGTYVPDMEQYAGQEFTVSRVFPEIYAGRTEKYHTPSDTNMYRLGVLDWDWCRAELELVKRVEDRKDSIDVPGGTIVQGEVIGCDARVLEDRECMVDTDSDSYKAETTRKSVPELQFCEKEVILSVPKKHKDYLF